ncbi:MAG: hypothetical protein ABF271_14650 [Abyssibacter sp.]|uniref:hypothetical protein n=1 Tax=Abyssibacter sp. TaxID=2320200 RepID=UPI00321BD335
MKTQIALISSALMASGAALAGSGSVDTETSFETEQRSYESSTSGSGEISRDGISTELNREAEYSGPRGEASSSTALSSNLNLGDMVNAPDQAFNRMDEDRDGVLSKLETEDTPLADRFERADANGNAELSGGEFNEFVASLGDNMGDDSDAGDEAESEFDEAEEDVEDEFGE